MEPASDIKVAKLLGTWFTRLKELWQQVAKVEKAIEDVANLDSRVAALEKRLERAPGDACPHCGALEFRVDRSELINTRGTMYYYMKCKDCDYDERRTIESKNLQY